ncbi:MAG: hypothetical protein LBR79_06615 [Oscillospiraceae bacterium]|nr:hypothetical protein [Oscillospiraceae bacterium]
MWVKLIDNIFTPLKVVGKEEVSIVLRHDPIRNCLRGEHEKMPAAGRHFTANGARSKLKRLYPVVF